MSKMNEWEYEISFPKYSQLLNQEAQRLLNMWNFQYELEGQILRIKNVNNARVTIDSLLSSLHSSGYQEMTYRKFGFSWTEYNPYDDN